MDKIRFTTQFPPVYNTACRTIPIAPRTTGAAVLMAPLPVLLGVPTILAAALSIAAISLLTAVCMAAGTLFVYHAWLVTCSYTYPEASMEDFAELGAAE